MKITYPLIMIAFSVLAIIPSLALAEGKQEDKGGEARVEHYKHTAFKSNEEASASLDKALSEIGVLLGKDGGVGFVELESVHEQSYTLESVVDHYRAGKAYDAAKLDTLDEAVQAIHFASENQELTKTQDWYLKLKAAVEALSAAEVTEKPLEKKEFYEIVIKDHKFSPAEIRVPAGEKVKLIVDNQDSTPEEFESHDFNREKIIAGNSKATIFIGPLKPGKYHYFGEFNMDTAKGDIIAE